MTDRRCDTKDQCVKWKSRINFFPPEETHLIRKLIPVLVGGALANRHARWLLRRRRLGTAPEASTRPCGLSNKKKKFTKVGSCVGSELRHFNVQLRFKLPAPPTSPKGRLPNDRVCAGIWSGNEMQQELQMLQIAA